MNYSINGIHIEFLSFGGMVYVTITIPTDDKRKCKLLITCHEDLSYFSSVSDNHYNKLRNKNKFQSLIYKIYYRNDVRQRRKISVAETMNKVYNVITMNIIKDVGI